MSAMRHHAPGAPGAAAAPAGGASASKRTCRGCHMITRIPLFVSLISALSAPVAAGEPEVERVLPVSGLSVAFFDLIDDTPTWRIRFTAPGLASEDVDYASVSDDMAWLCQEEALPRLEAVAASPEHIVVTLMQEQVEFGAAMPGIRQFFESYTVEDGLCIWEVY